MTFVTTQLQREVAHVAVATQLIFTYVSEEFSVSMFRVQIILEVQENLSFTCYLLIVQSLMVTSRTANFNI
jgi:hypothetical protein